ncbi:MAG TPA: hypothetical protein VIF09_24690 [Polyangiaceae bacterium]|jgi:hypothetical protein
MRRCVLVSLLVAGLAFASRARAGNAVDQAAATELFNAGRDLMKGGDFAAACPKLTESVRLEPTVGALAKLAECEEHERRTVSAYGRWQQARNLARASSDDRLVDVEHEFARLDGVVPKLRVIATGALPEGIVVHVDDVEIGSGSVGVALPVESGAHTVTASAPRKRPWTVTIETPANGATTTVTLPELVDVPSSPAVPTSEPSPQPTTPARRAGSMWRPVGVVTAGTGLVAIAAGFAAGVAAMHQRDDAGCPGNLCPSSGAADTLRMAKTTADWSTALFVAGGAFAIGGATVWWLSGRPASAAAVYVTPAGVAGRF